MYITLQLVIYLRQEPAVAEDENKPEPKKVAASPGRSKFVPLFGPEGRDRTVIQIPGRQVNFF